MRVEIRNDIAPDSRAGTPVWLWLALSLGIHALVLYLQLSSPAKPLAEAPQEPIEIQQIPPAQLAQMLKEQARERAKKQADPRELRMAETEDANNKDIDPNAKFLSDRNQKAQKQTKAKSVDDFRKAQGTGGKGVVQKPGESAPPTGEESEKLEEQIAATDDDIADGTGVEPKKTSKGGVKRDWKTLSLKDLSIGGDGSPTAATDDKLDGVADGDRTVLSTREFRYFSYYHRIKELLRQYWKPTVERKLMSLWAKGRQLGEDEMVTKVLVLLDEKGAIQKISRVASSGFAELDEAAMDAFQKAGPFPNPPKGIIEDDGFVRIRWDFILKTEAAPRIQFQSSGNNPVQ